jgi:lipopolysaccharide heptosyltransferase II
LIRLDNIGDVVMLGPAMRALRQALPEAALTLLCSPAGSQVAPLLPWLDDVMVTRATWQDASGALPLDPARELALVAEVRARRFDAALIFTSFSQSPYPPAYVCYLAGVPIRIGQSREFGGSMLSRWVRPLPDPTHQVDRNLHLLTEADIPLAGRHLELRVPPAVQASADDLLRARGIDPATPLIVLAPGASCVARRYDPGRFAAVARQLVERTGLPGVVIGSAREEALATSVVDGSAPSLVSLVGHTSVPEMAAVIQRASLVIANNSGPLHVADAFRRPMVILFSGTDHESQWQPRAGVARLLRRATTCSPCFRFDCPYEVACLDLPPTEVVAAALDLLTTPSAEGSAVRGALHHIAVGDMEVS